MPEKITRRQFIKGSAVAASALVLPTIILKPSDSQKEEAWEYASRLGREILPHFPKFRKALGDREGEFGGEIYRYNGDPNHGCGGFYHITETGGHGLVVYETPANERPIKRKPIGDICYLGHEASILLWEGRYFSNMLYSNAKIDFQIHKKGKTARTRFIWEKNGNKGKLTRLILHFPAPRIMLNGVVYQKDLDWKLSKVSDAGLPALPESIQGLTQVAGVDIPWEIDYEQKAHELVEKSGLPTLHKEIMKRYA